MREPSQVHPLALVQRRLRFSCTLHSVSMLLHLPDKAGSVRKSASVDSPAPKRRKLEAEDEDVDEEQEVSGVAGWLAGSHQAA